MNENKTKILLVDDHQILLDGIKNMLEGNDFTIVAIANDTSSALEILNKTVVDILITDIHMPGDDGLILIKKVKVSFPDIKIVVLSMHEEKSIIQEAIQLGINGYILKSITHQKLNYALNRIRIGKFFISEEITYILIEKMSSRSNPRLLSDRELEVLNLIAKEYSNKMIAETLFISERTVETHRKNIFRKTNTQTIVGLIKFVMENKLF